MGDSAASWLKEWKGVQADCVKLLGKKGKLPKPKEDPAVRLSKVAAKAKELDDAIDKMLKEIRAYQTMLIFLQDEVTTYNSQVGKSEFGLSKANPDEERIINKVRQKIASCLAGVALGSTTPVNYAFKVRGVMESGDNMTNF